MKSLFVGGIADGRMYHCEKERVEILVRKGGGWSGAKSDPYEPELYRRVKIKGHKSEFALYLVRGMTIDEAMRKIIERYSQSKG
jgi:hypothetical protein